MTVRVEIDKHRPRSAGHRKTAANPQMADAARRAGPLMAPDEPIRFEC